MMPTMGTQCPPQEVERIGGRKRASRRPPPSAQPCGPQAFFNVQGKTVHAKAVWAPSKPREPRGGPCQRHPQWQATRRAFWKLARFTPRPGGLLRGYFRRLQSGSEEPCAQRRTPRSLLVSSANAGQLEQQPLVTEFQDERAAYLVQKPVPQDHLGRAVCDFLAIHLKEIIHSNKVSLGKEVLELAGDFYIKWAWVGHVRFHWDHVKQRIFIEAPPVIDHAKRAPLSREDRPGVHRWRLLRQGPWRGPAQVEHCIERKPSREVLLDPGNHSGMRRRKGFLQEGLG